MEESSAITHLTRDSVIGWLCVRPPDSDTWQHRCAVLDHHQATLTLHTSPPETVDSRIERVVQLGPGTACFPASDICPGLYTFVLRTAADDPTGRTQLLLGVPTLADTRRWLAHLQD